MKNILLYLFVCTAFTTKLFAQGITTPANVPLSVGSDLNLQPNKSIQVDGVTYLRMPPAGGSNVTLGLGAGASNLSGTQNLFLGANAGYYNNATANIFVGYRAGYNNVTGTYNMFVGVQAGQKNISGSSNVMLGTNAGVNNTTGNGNHFMGNNTGANNVSGGYNVYVGTNAGGGPGVNGDNNTAIGFEAGMTNVGGSVNTFVGFRADASANNLVNASALGTNAKVSQSNSLVLGNNANVGIGTSAPSARLELVSNNAGTSGLKLTNLTSRTIPTINTSKVLTVDTSGNVVLANVANGARLASEENSLWTQRGSLVELKQATGLVLGTGVSQTPAGYGLYVGQGILTEKVKVAVRNTSEWSDYVFQPGYRLRPLSEVERYVATNGHLPGVPSAGEVVSQGIDVGKMDATLLEKIEELTLYTIQLEKLAKKQDETIQKLLQRQDKLEKLLKKPTTSPRRR